MYILTKTEAEAAELVAKVKGGADFKTLARDKSLAASGKAVGGDYGFVSRGMLPPEIDEVAFSLKAGEIKFFPGPRGHHILQVVAKRPASSAFILELRRKADIKTPSRPRQRQVAGRAGWFEVDDCGGFRINRGDLLAPKFIHSLNIMSKHAAVKHGQKIAVVTGGAGFIGSHLVERLLKEGCRVRVLDNLATGSLQNLAAHRGNRALSFHRVELSRAAHIRSLFEGARWVFHLAALADIVPSIANPLRYHKANVDSTAAVLEAARKAGVQRFIYAASSSCYGIPDTFPTPETAPAKPQYPYALTKYVGEQYVLHWSNVYKIPCVALRLFNVYGPRSRTRGAYGAAFGVFLAQKLAGKPFTVVGDGTQTRDFTFVTDVAEAFVKAANSDLSGEVFNVGSGGTYSVNSLINILGGPVSHVPKRPGEPDCTFADISKIKRMLGWSPRVSFDEGVRIMLKNIEHWLDAPVWDAKSIAKATQEWFAVLGRTEAHG